MGLYIHHFDAEPDSDPDPFFRCGSADPDPYPDPHQNDADPQHYFPNFIYDNKSFINFFFKKIILQSATLTCKTNIPTDNKYKNKLIVQNRLTTLNK